MAAAPASMDLRLGPDRPPSLAFDTIDSLYAPRGGQPVR
jgi:hypothetical protein